MHTAVSETIISSSIIPELSHMGRVHEPWGDVIEPLLLKYYCTFSYTNYNELPAQLLPTYCMLSSG